MTETTKNIRNEAIKQGNFKMMDNAAKVKLNEAFVRYDRGLVTRQ